MRKIIAVLVLLAMSLAPVAANAGLVVSPVTNGVSGAARNAHVLVMELPATNGVSVFGNIGGDHGGLNLSVLQGLGYFAAATFTVWRFSVK